MPTTLITRPSASDAADAAADALVATLRGAVAAHGVASVAFSGGSTPGPMFRALAASDLDWSDVHVFQVDERIAADGDPDRNLTGLRSVLLGPARVPDSNVHIMPVDVFFSTDLSTENENGRATAAQQGALADYSSALTRVCGGVLDVVHLGLGDDGHTASLVPDDPVLDVRDRDVAVTHPYKGHRRMTLTFEVLDRARLVLWLVAGASKVAVLPELLAGSELIPAGRVRAADAVVFCDAAAAAAVPSD